MPWVDPFSAQGGFVSVAAYSVIVPSSLAIAVDPATYETLIATDSQGPLLIFDPEAFAGMAPHFYKLGSWMSESQAPDVAWISKAPPGEEATDPQWMIDAGTRFRIRAVVLGNPSAGDPPLSAMRYGVVGQSFVTGLQDGAHNGRADDNIAGGPNDWIEFTSTGTGFGPGFGVDSGAITDDGMTAYLQIEVWVDGPGPDPGVSLNCECEDISGNRTRGQLLTDLLARLGFADPIATAERRTLGALRRDLMSRLGFSGQVDNPPPGMLDLLDSIINESEQTLWRRLELDRGGEPLPARMTEPEDLCTLDAPMVFALALAGAKAHYQKPDAKLYIDTAERMLTDHLRRRPPGVMATLGAILTDAQEQLYRRYDVLRTERFFTWPIEVGVRLYDIPDNAETCEKRLDPRKITWVGIDRDEIWTPLGCGITPELYSYNQAGTPQRYEIRQCIELWPTPDETRGRLVIKGHFGLEPFTDDEHPTTIDDRAVFLLALANAKAQYQQDGSGAAAQLETLINGLVAGSHQTRRYIPGRPRHEDRTYSIPRTTEPFV